MKKVAAGNTTVYIFAGAKVIAEYVNGAAVGSPAREYIYSGSALVATHEGGALTFHYPDHLSTRVTSDSAGANRTQQAHFPFGESWYNSSGTKLLFTSYERDSESGNDYAIFRTHIPRLGRFSRPDPLAGSLFNPQSLNSYAYTLNDPTDLSDPLGLSAELATYPATIGPEPYLGGAGLTFGGGGGFSASSVCSSYADGGYLLSYLLCLRFLGAQGPHEQGGLDAPLNHISVTSASTEGPLQEPIKDTLRRLAELLPDDKDCLSFLSSGGTGALKHLESLQKHNLVGHGLIFQGLLPLAVSATTGAGAGGQAITVNIFGPFYAGSVGNFKLSVNNGRIKGGTPKAQAFILLHELGHSTDVLRPDAGDKKAGRMNDSDIANKCKKDTECVLT